MSIDNSNSQCIKSKYFTGKIAMDESLSDFQETKPSSKGPKTTQKAVKPKARKVTKHIKGQKDIRTVLKAKKNELISYAKDFDTVCKKAGLEVDSEQLQIAIALSKSLQTEEDNASTSHSLTTQGRIAKIKTTLQEYGFKVPETKITAVNKRIKKDRKQYKLINTTEEERHQNISRKYSQLLYTNTHYTNSGAENTNSESDTPVFNIATILPYEFMKDNSVFYTGDLVNKSTTTGSLLRDWSGIPGRPISPIHFDTVTMNFSQIVCSQDELDVILSGSIECAKTIIANKHIDNVNEDIDLVLPKVVIRSSYKENETKFYLNNTEDNVDDDSIIFVKEINVPNDSDTKSPGNKPECSGTGLEIVDQGDTGLSNTSPIKESYRSCSPDIFDDEDLCILETSKPIMLFQEQKTKVFTEDNDIMDLTECANKIVSQNTEQPLVLSQNITKRRSDDFMEMTECAVTASQGVREVIREVDLTQSLEENSLMVGAIHNEEVDSRFNFVAESPDYSVHDSIIVAGNLEKNYDNSEYDIDLNEDANDDRRIAEESNKVPKHIVLRSGTENGSDKIVVENLKIQDFNLSNEHPKDINIDLTQSSNEDNIVRTDTHDTIETPKDKCESMDLTQSSRSSIDVEDLPIVNLSTQCQSNLDDTIILNEEEYMGSNDKVKGHKSEILQGELVFDLTEASEEVNNTSTKNKVSKLCSQSFYDDFVHDHSDSKENIDGIEVCGDNNIHDISNDIDLTQSSGELAKNSDIPRPVTAIERNPNHSSLGKTDDVSIDYDDICEYVSDKESSCCTDKDSLKLNHDSSKSKTFDDVEVGDNNNEQVSNSSQTEVFDLTDKELDYSLHKSRYDMPIDDYYVDFGGISIMDDVTGVSLRKSLDQRNSVGNKDCTEDLPEIDVKNTKGKCIEIVEPYLDTRKTVVSTRVESVAHNTNGTFPIVTPKNSKYIIKTKDVTPMLDYASMTTPQRNRELDKYGLKPFKRKRAIQILTHLYNQTHPVIQSYVDDEQPSPKKPRRDTQQLPSKSRTQLPSPRKPEEINYPPPIVIANSKSPKKATGMNKSEDSSKEGTSSIDLCAYEVTSELPSIRSIDCGPEDWVFQKREKAKVHSCRVPLHIAFYNYVSSRRELREAILKYEPVNIDFIHKDLVSYGHRYDPKDLLRFLDKRCITVKTADNNARNKR